MNHTIFGVSGLSGFWRGQRGLLLVGPPLAAYALLGGIFPELAQQSLSFVLFFSVFLLLPSCALGNALVRGDYSLSEKTMLGYPVAQTALFLLIYATALTRLLWLPLALPAVSLGLAALLLRRKRSAVLPLPTLLLTLAIMSLGIALCFVKFLHVPLPTLGQPADIYHDEACFGAYTWSCVRQLLTGEPFTIPFLSGYPFAYHLMPMYQQAWAYILLGLRPMEQVMYLWAPAHWGMLAGAVVVAARRFGGLGAVGTALAALLLLFFAGPSFNASHGLQIYEYYHTYFHGLPGFLIFSFLLYGYLNGRVEKLDVTFATALFFAAAGNKAHLLMFLPLSLFPVLAYRVATRRVRREELLLCLGFCLVFAVLMLTTYKSTGASMVVFRDIRFTKLFMGALGRFYDMLSVFGAMPLLAYFAAAASPVLWHKLARDKQYYIFLATFVLSSCVFLKLVNYVGGDFYFFWHARILVVVGFAAALEHIVCWRKTFYSILVIGYVLVSVGFLLHDKFLATSEMWRPRNYAEKLLDVHEVEGLNWASEHLDRRKVMFTNKYQFAGKYLGVYQQVDIQDYLGFSGMQGYASPIDGISHIQKEVARRLVLLRAFWDATTPTDREKALESIEADYYFHCETLSPSADYDGIRNLKVVYKNPTLTIFEIVKRN